MPSKNMLIAMALITCITFKIKAGRPVGVFFPEEVHNTKLIKKRKPPELSGGFLNNILIRYYFV
jgi:hypothetical protein